MAAGKVLHLSHPTLSAQIKTLEHQLGEQLFVKLGRKLTLTETGQIVFRYADEIFRLGGEMIEVEKGRVVGHSPRLVCREDSFENLLSKLASRSLSMARRCSFRWMD